MANQPISEHQGGIITVAVAAQFSFLATLLLIGILIYHRLRLWNPNSRSVIGSEEFCLKFLRSQFAILFFDLLVSDLIQASGFLLNLAYVGHTEITNSAICVAQGVLIQLGDTSGAFATLAIAIHTFIVLIRRTPPSTSTLLISMGVKWAIALVLTLIGPIVFAQESLGPFYAPAGGWCWIGSAYPWERLVLHYIWLFIAGASSTILYGLIFLIVRRRIRTHVTQTSDRSVEETSMENAAKKMLVYPICYLILLLPLGMHRLAGIFGHHWSLNAQLFCGVIFTLSGLVDSIVFCWTRNILSHRGRSGSRASESTIGMSSRGSAHGSIEKPQPPPPVLRGNRIKPLLPRSTKNAPPKSLASRINGSDIQFMPAKYSLATIDMNSFDDPDPSPPVPPSTNPSSSHASR